MIMFFRDLIQNSSSILSIRHHRNLFKLAAQLYGFSLLKEQHKLVLNTERKKKNNNIPIDIKIVHYYGTESNKHYYIRNSHTIH